MLLTFDGAMAAFHPVADLRVATSQGPHRVQKFTFARDASRNFRRLLEALTDGLLQRTTSHLATLSSAAFWKSTTGLAHDSNDRLIYETDGLAAVVGNASRAQGGPDASADFATLAPSGAKVDRPWFPVNRELLDHVSRVTMPIF